MEMENWHRPKHEINVLMNLYAEYLSRARPNMMDNNVRMCHFGRREGLPKKVLRELDRSVEASASNTGMRLCLALNYGSRAEIVDAVRRIARRVAAGQLDPEAIQESDVSDSLSSAGVPDPDLVVRTAGEMRLSNFLLWQVSYAEFYVTEKYWPDFDEAEFHSVLRAYAARDRRFGGLTGSNR